MVNLTLCPESILLVVKLSKFVFVYPASNLPHLNLLMRLLLPTLESPTRTTVQSCLLLTLMMSTLYFKMSLYWCHWCFLSSSNNFTLHQNVKLEFILFYVLLWWLATLNWRAQLWCPTPDRRTRRGAVSRHGHGDTSLRPVSCSWQHWSVQTIVLTPPLYINMTDRRPRF